MITLSLFLALVASILLLPPWSPLSLTSQQVSEKVDPAQRLSNSEVSKEASETSRDRGPESTPASTKTTEAVTPVDQLTTPESRKGLPEATTGRGPDNVPELIQATEHPDWKVRWDAVNALGTLQDPRGIPALVKRALHDENPHPRWRSLWALSAVERSGQETFPLLRIGLQSPDPVVVHNAAVALAFFGQPEARPELLRRLKDPDSFRRWEAVFSLRAIGGPEVAKALIPLLEEGKEPDAGVRGEVSLTLGSLGEQAAVSALLKALRGDRSPEVRWRAALALSQLADSSVMGELEQALSTEQNPTVRKQLEEAIAQSRQRVK